MANLSAWIKVSSIPKLLLTWIKLLLIPKFTSKNEHPHHMLSSTFKTSRLACVIDCEVIGVQILPLVITTSICQLGGMTSLNDILLK
jgi:hypothetical protein